MKTLLSGMLWLAGFLLAGFLAGEICKPILVVGLHNPFWAIWPYAGAAGAVLAGIVFCIGIGFRRWRCKVARPIKFGPWQAVWLLTGFLLAQLAGLGGFCCCSMC